CSQGGVLRAPSHRFLKTPRYRFSDLREKTECMGLRFSAASTADRLLPEPLAARARPFLDRLDAVVFTADDRGQASRTSLTAFAIRIVSAAIALISQIMMARWMGGFEYGIFVLVWTTMIIVGNLSCLGFHTSIVRYIPEYRERG